MPENIGSIVAQAFGLEQPILVAAMAMTPAAGQAGRRQILRCLFPPSAGLLGGSPEGEAFVAAYHTEYNRAPESAFAALGYDG